MCDAGANPILEHYFRDCIYNARDLAGFCLGMASIGCWVVAQLPQIVSNIRTRNVEALSPWFLAEWLLGDTCNLIGCILSGTQLPTQLYSAMYFIIMDCIMVIQYVWYGTLQRRKQRRRTYMRHRSPRHGISAQGASAHCEAVPAGPPVAVHTRQGAKTRVLAFAALVVLAQSRWQGRAGSHWQEHRPRDRLQGSVAARRLLVTMPLAVQWHWRSEWTALAGSAIGYLSTAFYLGSRVSQIFKNWQRSSAEGLAIAMFMCAIAANLLYGFGIFVRAYTWSTIVSSAPWILGSLGTVALDAIIFWQWRFYSSAHARRAHEEQALLEGEPGQCL